MEGYGCCAGVCGLQDAETEGADGVAGAEAAAVGGVDGYAVGGVGDVGDDGVEEETGVVWFEILAC